MSIHPENAQRGLSSVCGKLFWPILASVSPVAVITTLLPDTAIDTNKFDTVITFTLAALLSATAAGLIPVNTGTLLFPSFKLNVVPSNGLSTTICCSRKALICSSNPGIEFFNPLIFD